MSTAMHKMCWRLGTVDNAHNEGVTLVVVVLVKPFVSHVPVRQRFGTVEWIRGQIEPKVDEHRNDIKNTNEKTPGYGGKDRDGQVAQAATAVRSKETMLLAFSHRHLRCRKPVHPHKWRCGESNPSPTQEVLLYISRTTLFIILPDRGELGIFIEDITNSITSSSSQDRSS